MKRLFLFIFLILLFLDVSSAVNLGISPPKIEFNGYVNKKICRNVVIYAKDYNGYLMGEDKWKSGEESRDLNQYDLDSSFFDIKMDYLNEYKVDKKDYKKEIKVCITPQEGGIYYGALVFTTENSYASVGSWLILNIAWAKGKVDEVSEINSVADKENEPSSEPSSFAPVTGSVTGVFNNKQSMITLFFLLLVTVLALVWLIKKEV